MAEPDPQGVTLDDGWPDRITLLVETFGNGNRKARIVRAKRILRNLQWGGWLCQWCREPVPLWRRADARFCCEGCRKRAARQRRQARGTR